MELLGKIRTLDESTVNKIAAGEVVERPASVVKELVENSLDAGANTISVHVEDGGRKRITVRDDGCGMSREDALAAFGRHATSKISAIDDLQTLDTYGFRGEALSSIASVSTVVLRTIEHGEDEGTEVTAEPGRPRDASPVGCPPGTEISVTHLFENIPARKKALKSKATELAHCREVVVDYMLSRPGISFSFHSDGKMILIHSPAEGMNGSLAVAFGDAVAENMAQGRAEDQGIVVECYLSRLEHTKSSPSDLKLYVNGRPVRSTRIVSTVVRAFGSKLMKDRYPIGVVRIAVDSSIVDVNVHPSKREVRFDDEATVLSVIEQSVQSAFEEADLAFRYDLTQFGEAFEPSSVHANSGGDSSVQSVLSIEQNAHGNEASPIVPLAQIMNTYILAESSGSLILIDQHAASERVVYESILRSLKTGVEISQELLTPLVINLTVSEARTLEDNRVLVEKSGFHVEPFGTDAHALRAIPTVLGVAQGEAALRSILADLSQMPSPKRLGQDVIWRVACHTAIRAGDPLSQPQMRQLISDLLRTDSPHTCEHGRPTMVMLTPADLEKLFRRRV
ncbi:DNA mismatch repair endonuclease MutL [Candidatus Bathyarchaeota archaeon]|nr:DNA mismatch repair endonuclease MutL [Candidatus Bathyarchaeota archaeon]